MTTELSPLSGIRVLDLSWVLAGPLVGRLMADAGAEVVKIESAERMDNTRLGRPLPATDESSESHDRVPLFHALNAGKQSVAINLRAAAAAAVVKRIVATCDVVIENFAPGVLDRLGLGYEALREVKPGIVVLSMSGTGADGPLSDVPAYAATVTSLAGLESVVGYAGEPPIGMLGANFADSIGGLFGFHAVLSALWARDEVGVGQHIDYSEMEGVCTFLAEGFIDYFTNGRVLAPSGNAHRTGSPYGVFPTAGEDSWIAIGVTSDEEWSSLCSATEGEAWVDKAEFSTIGGRLRHRVSLEDEIGRYTARHERDVLVRELRDAGVAASAVYSVGEQATDEHFWERGLLVRLDDVPGAGDVVIYGSPWTLSETPVAPRGPAPRLGEHTREVLSRVAGLSEAELDELDAAGVLR
jgi:benzylsuccinate CoA-transferase BbsF subunit